MTTAFPAVPSTDAAVVEAQQTATGLAFVKGHGTENDFVLVVDPDGALDLGAQRVAALCDRRAGIGADGLIRVVRSERCPDGVSALAEDPQADWFMDYRNADGSVAEMCGNGIRVLVAHLVQSGLVDVSRLTRQAPLPVGSRGGVKRVYRRPGGWFAVDMGPWTVVGGGQAIADGYDALVHVPGLDVSRPALSMDLGNPHTVVVLSDLDELEAVDLHRAPEVDPVPVDGTNVELVVALDAEEDAEGPVGRLAMRVHERGVGETRSCGTGACAAAMAARVWAGEGAPNRWRIDVPGGVVEVTALAGDRVELAGPAVIVASGTTSL